MGIIRSVGREKGAGMHRCLFPLWVLVVLSFVSGEARIVVQTKERKAAATYVQRFFRRWRGNRAAMRALGIGGRTLGREPTAEHLFPLLLVFGNTACIIMDGSHTSLPPRSWQRWSSSPPPCVLLAAVEQAAERSAEQAGAAQRVTRRSTRRSSP